MQHFVGTRRDTEFYIYFGANPKALYKTFGGWKKSKCMTYMITYLCIKIVSKNTFFYYSKNKYKIDNIRSWPSRVLKKKFLFRFSKYLTSKILVRIFLLFNAYFWKGVHIELLLFAYFICFIITLTRFIKHEKIISQLLLLINLF